MKNHVATKTLLSNRAEDLSVDIFRNIMRVRQLMHRKASVVAASMDLHAAELNVVDILGKFGPISMGRLARETFISPANTTNTVKKLEQTGLVSRTRSSESLRQVTVSLTRQGEATFRRCYPRILTGVYEHMADRLSQREMSELAKLLRRLVE